MEFFLAIKIFKQKLCWQKCVGLLALSAFGYILLHGRMQSLSIPTEAQFKKFPIFSDGWTCFSQRSQLILCVCCYYYLHSLRNKIQRIIIRRKNTIISGLQQISIINPLLLSVLLVFQLGRSIFLQKSGRDILSTNPQNE